MLVQVQRVYTVQYHSLCPNIVTAVLLLYIPRTGYFPPDLLCLSMCKEFTVNVTISSVVFQNKVITAVL